MLTAVGQLAAVFIGIPSLIYLARSNQGANKGAAARGRKRSYRPMGRSYQVIAR